jgi:hypothetical protein
MEQMVDGLSWSLYQQPKRVVIHRTWSLPRLTPTIFKVI